MAAGGNFISEAYRDGETYFFEATFTLWRWSANLWDEHGRRCGSIACSPLASSLEGDALEDAVCDWVHRAVAYGVGFVPQPAPAMERILPHFSPAPQAANAGSFGDKGSEPPRFQIDVHGNAARAQARHRDLQSETTVAMDRFCLAAEEFRRLSLALGERRQLLRSEAAAKKPKPHAASFQAAGRPPG